VELMRGNLDKSAYNEIVATSREDLKQRANAAGSENFLLDFLQRWKVAEE